MSEPSKEAMTAANRICDEYIADDETRFESLDFVASIIDREFAALRAQAEAALRTRELAAEQWPTDVLCRLLLPLPMQSLGAIATAIGAVARKNGMDARMRQVGNVLEFFTVPNDHARVGERKL